MNAQPAEIQADIVYVQGSGEPLMVHEPLEGTGVHQQNFDHESRKVPIVNARLVSPSPALDQEGYALVKQATAFNDFSDPELIKKNYYPEMEQLVKGATGASRVFVFDHNVRIDDSDEALKKGTRGPSRNVHNDYTESSAHQRMKDMLPETGAHDGRFAFINAWRPLRGPIKTAHLAVCDAMSVPPESWLKAELHYVDRVGEVYYCAYNEAHQWYYYPDMTPDEVLLLKCYDSAEDGRASFTPHTAIDDPTAPADTPARQSIEVRTIAFFD